MAGGLTISTLNDSSGVLATQNGMSGIAKAWVNFNGTNGTVRGSFNVGSVTRNSTGNYTLNFTTAMPNTSYSPVAMNGSQASGDGTNLVTTIAYNFSVSSFQLITQYPPNGASYDNTFVGVAIFR